MSWIETKKRTDGGTSCIVRWRLGGTRGGKPQNETFSAGTDEQNMAQAEGFKQMVTAAGEYWPDGWVKGRGFVRESGPAQEVPAPARTFHDVGQDYVNQIVGCSPGQRSRYRSQIRLLDTLEVKGPACVYKPFGRMIGEITEDDVSAYVNGRPVPHLRWRMAVRDVSARRIRAGHRVMDSVLSSALRDSVYDWLNRLDTLARRRYPIASTSRRNGTAPPHRSVASATRRPRTRR